MLPDQKKLQIALFVMRISIAAFFLVWAVEKIVAPDLALRVFTTFYFAEPSTTMLMLTGVIQTVIVLAFAAGLFKFWTYGALLVMHAISTLSTWQRLINPYELPNHLFWAAIPVLGALFALFWLRDQDVLFNFNATKG